MKLLNIMLSKAYEIGILFICKHLCSEIFFMHYLNVLKTTSLKDMCALVENHSQSKGASSLTQIQPKQKQTRVNNWFKS